MPLFRLKRVIDCPSHSAAGLSVEAQTLAAWRQSQEANVPLTQANSEQRFALVVKYVLELVNDPADVGKVEASLARCEHCVLTSRPLVVFQT